MLAFHERKAARELELTHGVIINLLHDHTLVAKRWRDDTVLAEADTVIELGVVLRSLHIYEDTEVETST